MKTRLTPKESQHLISLGVPKEKASGDKISTIEMTAYSIFTLEDFLNGEILPLELVDKEHKVYNLSMECITGLCGINDTLWHASYMRGEHTANWFSEIELIDALYKLACWYYGEYLKSEKK